MLEASQFKIGYKTYKNLLKQTSTEISKNIGTKVEIIPTSKKICKTNGIEKEAANSINTASFLEKVYLLLKNKGYNLPKIYLDEEQLPRKYNIAGCQMGNFNIFGPARLDVSNPSLVIHEEGHFLHKKNMKYNQPLYAMFCAFRSLFRPFLNKKEKQILTNDFKRAYDEGYFRNLQMDKCVKKGYITKETSEKFKQTPEKFLVRNALTNVSEFIAEYFTLASQGFKFSPEIEKRYKAFHGPEIKELITKDEIDELMKYKNMLENRKIYV